MDGSGRIYLRPKGGDLQQVWAEQEAWGASSEKATHAFLENLAVTGARAAGNAGVLSLQTADAIGRQHPSGLDCAAAVANLSIEKQHTMNVVRLVLMLQDSCELACFYGSVKPLISKSVNQAFNQLLWLALYMLAPNLSLLLVAVLPLEMYFMTWWGYDMSVPCLMHYQPYYIGIRSREVSVLCFPLKESRDYLCIFFPYQTISPVSLASVVLLQTGPCIEQLNILCLQHQQYRHCPVHAFEFAKHL